MTVKCQIEIEVDFFFLKSKEKKFCRINICDAAHYTTHHLIKEI